MSTLRKSELCMKYEIPQMLKGGKGAIVNTASIGGFAVFSKISSYIASKFEVIDDGERGSGSGGSS